MKVCISCQEDVEGKQALKIKEDRIIKTIRSVKKTFGIAAMNELYVCEDDVKEHLKRRRSFEKSMLVASVLSGLILLFVLVMLVASNKLDLWAFLSAFIIAGFVLVLPLFKYAPAIEEGAAVLIKAKPLETTAKKRRSKTSKKKK